MATGEVCPRCDHIHAKGDVRAIGRFSNGPIMYQAVTFPQAPVRSSRVRAMQDACRHRIKEARRAEVDQ